MSAPGVTASVYVDGSKLADDAASYLASVPTVLSGLSTAWGRGTVVDQPETASCSFTLRDKGGDGDFLSLINVGHTVDVYASGAIVPGPTPQDVAIDGSFEINPASNRVTVANGAVAYDTRAHSGNRSFRVAASSTPRAVVTIPPGPWSTATTAWDAIPTTALGEIWTVRLYVSPFIGGNVTIQLALFDSPVKAAPSATPATANVPLTAGAYTPVEVSWTVDAAHIGKWVGLVITLPTPVIWTQAVGTWADQTLTWADYGSSLLDDMQSVAPAQAQRRVLVFTGRITDIAAKPVSGAVEVTVTAVDPTADLANDNIGDDPWLVQTISARIARIQQLASTRFGVNVASTVGAYLVTWVDIDSQPVYALLQDLAVTADAVLWPAYHITKGFYLWYEDPLNRQALGQLYLDNGVVKINWGAMPQGGIVLSACDILQDGFTLQQDVSDVITRVDATYQTQATDEQGKPAPVETHVLVSMPDEEALYGVRRLGYSTQLVNAADCSKVATRVLDRSAALRWHINGVQWDTDITPEPFDPAHRGALLQLLDGTTRIGLPLTLTEMPEWAPNPDAISVYVEGGSYAYEGGAWRLSLTVSPAGTIGKGIHWNEVNPAYQWRQFDPSIRWLDMASVGKAA